jgi:hypothetical protein
MILRAVGDRLGPARGSAAMALARSARAASADLELMKPGRRSRRWTGAVAVQARGDRAGDLARVLAGALGGRQGAVGLEVRQVGAVGGR